MSDIDKMLEQAESLQSEGEWEIISKYRRNDTYVDDDGATQSYNNSFSLDTGSKVVANNGQAYTTNQKLEKLTINGNTYLVSGSAGGGTTTLLPSIATLTGLL